MNTTGQTNVFLGSGVLTWSKSERVSDRYGTVWLMPEGNNSLTPSLVPNLLDEQASEVIAREKLKGVKGRLVAVITATRTSTHLGDLFRGYYPSTPEVGDRLVLSEGVFFDEMCDAGGIQVGVRNFDGDYNRHWMNPVSLYRAHEQSVDLFFVRDES